MNEKYIWCVLKTLMVVLPSLSILYIFSIFNNIFMTFIGFHLGLMVGIILNFVFKPEDELKKRVHIN